MKKLLFSLSAFVAICIIAATTFAFKAGETTKTTVINSPIAKPSDGYIGIGAKGCKGWGICWGSSTSLKSTSNQDLRITNATYSKSTLTLNTVVNDPEFKPVVTTYIKQGQAFSVNDFTFTAETLSNLGVKLGNVKTLNGNYKFDPKTNSVTMKGTAQPGGPGGPVVVVVIVIIIIIEK
jgi:hypothetical protein